MIEPELLEAEKRRQEKAERTKEPNTISAGAAFDLSHLSVDPNAVIRRQQIESEERLRKIEALRETWNAPKRHVLAENLDRGDQWGKVEAKLKSMISTGFMVALVDKRGTGKTQIAVELMRDYTANLRRALYCTGMDVMTAVKGSYRSESKESEKDVIEFYRRPFFLVIDEVGKRSESEWENRILFDVLDKRYQDMKDTLLISNQSKAEFEASIGPSLASRMQETGGIIECNWKSYRS